MISLAKKRSAWAGPVGVLVIATSLCGASGAAWAEGNLFDFLSHAFGGGDSGGGYAQPVPQPEFDPGAAPPLTVRQRPRHRVVRSVGGSQRYNVADIKDVTMYSDKTLMPGDAVMTPTGLKIFAGAEGSTHTDDDFVAIGDSGRMSPAMRKQLIAMDNASRPELQR